MTTPTSPEPLPSIVEEVEESEDRRVTCKMQRVEIEAMLEQERSGLRPAVTTAQIESFELREPRDTVPAPPHLTGADVEEP